jgi:hypothetical protein
MAELGRSKAQTMRGSWRRDGEVLNPRLCRATAGLVEDLLVEVKLAKAVVPDVCECVLGEVVSNGGR